MLAVIDLRAVHILERAESLRRWPWSRVPDPAWLLALNAMLLQAAALIVIQSGTLPRNELQSALLAGDMLTILAGVCSVLAIGVALRAAWFSHSRQ